MSGVPSPTRVLFDKLWLRTLCFAGGEQRSRLSKAPLDMRDKRMRAAENAPRGPFYVLERRHSLAIIVERGAGVQAECIRVNLLHFERDFMTLAENASRCGHRLAQQ